MSQHKYMVENDYKHKPSTIKIKIFLQNLSVLNDPGFYDYDIYFKNYNLSIIVIENS